MATISLRIATPHYLSLLQHWDEQFHITGFKPDPSKSGESELKQKVDWKPGNLVFIHPMLIGGGKLVFPINEKTELEFIESQNFPCEVVMLKFKLKA